VIKLENVTKIYKGEMVALRDASVDIDKGEFVFLVGPSGSGKSTFLRLLNREERPEKGKIFVAGKDIAELPGYKVPYLRRNIGSVYQDFKLLPTKSVYENVAFALEAIGRPKGAIKEAVPQILDLVVREKLTAEQTGQLDRLNADRRAAEDRLAALAVTVSEQEVFRSVWDQAVAAHAPEVLPGMLRALLPHPAPGLTVDPIGLVLSAACAGLGLVAGHGFEGAGEHHGLAGDRR